MPPFRRSLQCGVAAAVSCLATASLVAQPSAPTGTIYMSTYTDKILVIDEATLAVRDSIKVSIGIPAGMLLSADRKHFYVLSPRDDQVEIVDIATRKATGKFTLNKTTDSASTIVQINGMNVDPKERFAVLLVKATTKQLDRYEIGKPMLLRYDLARKAVTDTIPWPRGEERDFAQILFSPAGDLMYFFTNDDVLVYDAVSLKQVDRWDLSQSFYEEGMGRINAGFGADIYEEPGFYTNLFRVTDPVNHRTLMGVARVDLVKRTVDYYTLGPSVATSFRLSPDKKMAYGIHNEVGNYQFWTFDLENRRVVGKTEFEGRPRMGLTVSSNGAFLYVHVAGNSIDVYDAKTFKKLRTVTYDADMTQMTLIPARAGGPGR
jgi:DNA-binding beta-propeller fold protein YncE